MNFLDLMLKTSLANGNDDDGDKMDSRINRNGVLGWVLGKMIVLSFFFSFFSLFYLLILFLFVHNNQCQYSAFRSSVLGPIAQ